MGCFSDEEVITVGSSAYNLAGDVAGRDNFMKNNVLSMLFSGTTKGGLGKGIVDAHIAGPAMSYIRFYRWAESSGYNNQVGNLGGLIYSANSLSTAGFDYLVPPKITHDQRSVSFTTSVLDFNLVALEWIINNRPLKRHLSFKVTAEKLPGLFREALSGKLVITYSDTTSETFTPVYDLVSNLPLVYLYHEERLKDSSTFTNTEWVIGLPPTKVGFTGLPVTVVQNIVDAETTTVVTSYSDLTPAITNTTTSPKNLIFSKVTGKYTKVTTIAATSTDVGTVTTFVQNEEFFYNVLYTTDVSFSTVLTDGITVTTTITVVTPYLEPYWKYKQVSTTISQEKWSPYLLKLYQKGTSIEGDDLLFNVPTTVQKFFPVIPLRRDNTMVDEEHFPTQYGWNRKAARKCFGTKKKYDTLISSLAENPSLSDIDHSWVVFGVSLSTKQQDGQKYLYEFFKNLSDSTTSALGTYKKPSSFETAWANFKTASQASTNDEILAFARPTPPTAQDYTLTINASAAAQDWLYNTSITCRGGGQIVGNGYHTKSLNKVGHCWVYAKSTITLEVPTYSQDTEGISGYTAYEPSVTTVIAFGKQTTEDIWVEYEFFDLVHVNTVYQGITATTLGTTAIASADENSSFILPLHKSVFTDLTLVRRTQLSLECSFLVVNYYDKQYIPWYASGFFQIVLIIVIIVVAVYTGYIGPESAGLFGTNVTAGATLGFTGIAATVAGAIANAVAAAIVSALITKVAISALGEEVGRIVGLIASMITINLMSSTGPFNLADSWAQMTKADNLIKLTMSGLQQYGTYIQGQATELNTQTQALITETNNTLKEISRLTQELMGDTGVNHTTITDAIRYATENPAQFLDRTTMTGTDIAETSIRLVEDFPAPQLALSYLD